MPWFLDASLAFAWYSLAFARRAAMASCADDPDPPAGGASSGEALAITLVHAGFRTLSDDARCRGEASARAAGDVCGHATIIVTACDCLARLDAFDAPAGGRLCAATGEDVPCQLGERSQLAFVAWQITLGHVSRIPPAELHFPKRDARARANSSFVRPTAAERRLVMHPAPPEDILPSRKGTRNPLVLVGAAATAGVLTAGFVAFKAGNANLSQTMMKARVFAQGATIALMVGTSGAVVMPSFTGSK